VRPTLLSQKAVPGPAVGVASAAKNSPMMKERLQGGSWSIGDPARYQNSRGDVVDAQYLNQEMLFTYKNISLWSRT